MKHPRLLIEEWLPAQAIGVECIRENSTGLHPPLNRLHIWWARRPLTVSRAAILASLLPADFDRDCFERLLGFGKPSSELARLRSLMDTGIQVEGGFGCGRAFSNAIREQDLQKAHEAMYRIWGEVPIIMDPMAGGGSIPLEAASLGLNVLANEYNAVACSLLEATLDYPFRFGASLAEKALKWGKIWENKAADRLEAFYPRERLARVHAYIFARTVPCPDTGHPTPLVPNWHLLKSKNGLRVVAEPVVNREQRTWTIRVREIGRGAGQLREPPQPTYGRGKGISLFTRAVIPADYIKAMAQQSKMGSVLYAIAIKTPNGLEFRPPEPTDLKALEDAEEKLNCLRPQWERDGIIPTEERYKGDCDRSYAYGLTTWASLFSPRQLLAMGVLVEELLRLRPEIKRIESEDMGEAVLHLLAFVIDKFINYNSVLASWHVSRAVLRSVFDRHDYSFKLTSAEMASFAAGGGLKWAMEDVLGAYEKLCELPRASESVPVPITFGSATNLLEIEDKSITAIVVDPPYADNVQYSELADFFYVWLKRTQGHRRPEWFSTYLCEHNEEAVVNITRHRENGKLSASEARAKAHEFYQRLMTDSFKEAHRILRDDGVLTVMFTHKKQEAWASLFESLIAAGFTITSTFPIKTESQHSLHQARKNAAQSTVILASRKRDPDAGRGYFDDSMKAEIRQTAQKTAGRLSKEGLNAIDQLVGAFGPAMEVFSRYSEVRTDTGEQVGGADAIQAAADAVADWRVDQLARRGFEGVDPESRFVLLCWDVLGAAEFRFNEAMLLGRSVGMDVNDLITAGLVSKSSDKVKLLTAKERRRERAVRDAKEQLELFEASGRGRRRRKRKIHPQDEFFASAIDMCHALALRHAEAGAGDAGIGAARGMALQQGWNAESPCAYFMEALLMAAPQAVRFPGKGRSKTVADEFPEFRAWHSMLKPLFGIDPPEWKEILEAQLSLPNMDEEEGEEEQGE